MAGSKMPPLISSDFIFNIKPSFIISVISSFLVFWKVLFFVWPFVINAFENGGNEHVKANWIYFKKYIYNRWATSESN